MGLISVAQLTLSLLFSGFLGITEVYNLARIDRINNHFVIPGTKQAGVSNPWTGGLFSHQPSIKRQITPILDHWYSEVLDMGIWGHLGTSLGEVSGGSILGSFWVNSEVNLGHSGTLISGNLINPFIWP